MSARVSIQTEDFDLADEIAALRRQDKRVGAVCSFVGTVREPQCRRQRRPCSAWNSSTTRA